MVVRLERSTLVCRSQAIVLQPRVQSEVVSLSSQEFQNTNQGLYAQVMRHQPCTTRAAEYVAKWSRNSSPQAFNCSGHPGTFCQAGFPRTTSGFGPPAQVGWQRCYFAFKPVRCLGSQLSTVLRTSPGGSGPSLSWRCFGTGTGCSSVQLQVSRQQQLMALRSARQQMTWST